MSQPTPYPPPQEPARSITRRLVRLVERIFDGLAVLVLVVSGLGVIGLCVTTLLQPVPAARSRPVAINRPAGAVGTPQTADFSPLSNTEREQIFERVWTLVDTRYAYTDFRGLDWPAVHKEYLPEVDAATDPADFYTLMSSMIDLLGDGHSAFLDPHQAAQHNADLQGLSHPAAHPGHVSAHRLAGTNIVYLDLPSFAFHGVAIEVRDALLRLAKDGPIDGLIIDLRLNGGGLLDDLEATLRLFVDGGNMGYEITREGREPIPITRGGTLAVMRGKPLVVLISEFTESAAERFAVAIHSRQRGLLLGTQTAGNTETVSIHALPDGSLLALAEAQYQLPDGSSIEDVGLMPDLLVDADWYLAPTDDDPQVQAALKQLQGK